jgi:hypothetical protein
LIPSITEKNSGYIQRLGGASLMSRIERTQIIKTKIYLVKKINIKIGE